jgi:hypothetical protein
MCYRDSEVNKKSFWDEQQIFGVEIHTDNISYRAKKYGK